VLLEFANLCSANLTLSLSGAGCFAEIVSLELAIFLATNGTNCLLFAGSFAAFVSGLIAVFLATVITNCLLIAGCLAAYVDHFNCELGDSTVVGSGRTFGVVAEVDGLACLKGYGTLKVVSGVALGGSLRIGYFVTIVNCTVYDYAVANGGVSSAPVAVAFEVVGVGSVNGSGEAYDRVEILLCGIPNDVVTHLGYVYVVAIGVTGPVTYERLTGSEVLNGAVGTVVPLGLGAVENTVNTVTHLKGEVGIGEIFECCDEVVGYRGGLFSRNEGEECCGAHNNCEHYCKKFFHDNTS
jgi:hypothetical protein